MDGDGETVKNIEKNGKGNVSCFIEEKYQSLSLKGIFSIHPIDGYSIIDERLNAYQKFIDYKNPVIISFDVYTAKVHNNGSNYFEQIEDL